MASDNTRKLMLAKVLNSARAANILDENDSDGIRGLIADYFATVPAVEGEDAVDGEEKSDKYDIKMVSESRRDVINSNGDSQENCDIESSGGCADDSEDSISDDEGVVDKSVSQIQTDIQDNMTLNSDTQLLKVQNFQCKYKRRAQLRKTSTLAGWMSVKWPAWGLLAKPCNSIKGQPILLTQRLYAGRLLSFSMGKYERVSECWYLKHECC